MDPVIGASLIGAGTSLLSGLFGSSAQSSANAANLQIARENREWQESMWNKQNEYNTPAAQIERMKSAGLNPALMYSQGNPGNASNPPSSPATPQMQPITGFANAVGDAGDMIYKGMIQNEQVKQMRAQTEFLNARAAKEQATTPEREWFANYFQARTKNVQSSIGYIDSKTVGQDIYNMHEHGLLSTDQHLREKQMTKMNFDMVLAAADLQLRGYMTQSRINLNKAQIGYYNATVKLLAQKYDIINQFTPQEFNLLTQRIANVIANTDATTRGADRQDKELILHIMDRVLKSFDIVMPDVMPVAF